MARNEAISDLCQSMGQQDRLACEEMAALSLAMT